MAEQPNCVSGGSESLLDTAGATITQNTARYKTGLSGSRKRGNPSNHQTPSRKRSRKDSHTVAPTKENIFEEDSESLSDLRTNQRLGKGSVVTESINFSTLDRTNSPVVGLSGSRDKTSVPEVLHGSNYCTATSSTTRRGTRGRGHSRRAQKNDSSCDIAVPPVNPLGTGRGKLTGCSLGFSSAESEGTAVSTRSCTAASGRKTNHSDSAVQPRVISKIDNGAAATSARGGRGGRGGSISSSNSSRNSSQGPHAKTTSIISSASTRGKTANNRRNSRSTSVASVPAAEDVIATSQLSTTKSARKPSSSASTYSYSRTSSITTSQSQASETFSSYKLTTSESNSSTGAIKKQYTVAHQQEVSVRSFNRRQRNGNNNNNVTITGSSVRVGASAAWEVKSDKNSPLVTVSCKSYSTSASSYTHPGSSQSGKSIGRGRKRDLTAHSTPNNQIITETSAPIAPVKKYPLRSQVRLGICGSTANSVNIASTTQSQRRNITVVPKKKAKVADSTRNLGGNQSTASSESTATHNKEVPGAGSGGGVGGGGGGGRDNIQTVGRGHLLRRSTRSKTTTGSCASSR